MQVVEEFRRAVCPNVTGHVSGFCPWDFRGLYFSPKQAVLSQVHKAPEVKGSVTVDQPLTSPVLDDPTDIVGYIYVDNVGVIRIDPTVGYVPV